MDRWNIVSKSNLSEKIGSIFIEKQIIKATINSPNFNY